MAERLIGMLIFPRLTQLDMTGPYEVLARLPNTKVHLVAHTMAPVKTDRGMEIVPTITLADCPQLDLVCVPGGAGMNPLMEDAETLAFLKKQAAGARYVTSVCTGALALAKAGLLRNRPATTWWGRLDRLAELEPTVEVRPDDRFVDSGEIITAAGVSAGIDMALHLVARLHSVERAREVRRYIQYDH